MPRGWWGAVPRGGLPAIVVRGVWCQALSLPRPPVLWAGRPGFRNPCVPGAVGAGVGTQHRPHSACALAGRRCSLWGWRKGIPGGGAFQRCEGRLRSGALPPPTARPLGGLLGSATHVLWARVCGCGGPTLPTWPACPVGAACRGGGGGPSPGGVACHRCEGRLVSGAVPPPAARPLGRADGVPRPVCPGCGRCGHGDPATAPRHAPLRAGVARCGSGGRASPRGVPSTVMRGVCGQTLPLPRLPAHWAGCWGPSPSCCGRGRVGVGAHHCPLGLHALWRLRAAGVVGGQAVRRCPSPGRPSSGAGSRGSATRVSRVRSVRAWGISTSPTVCALAGRRCSLWGWRKGVPGGVPSTVVRGLCGQALPLPRLPAHWAGCWGPPPT